MTSKQPPDHLRQEPDSGHPVSFDVSPQESGYEVNFSDDDVPHGLSPVHQNTVTGASVHHDTYPSSESTSLVLSEQRSPMNLKTPVPGNEVDERSKLVGERSKAVDRRSARVREYSEEVDKRSREVDKRSEQVDKRSELVDERLKLDEERHKEEIERHKRDVERFKREVERSKQEIERCKEKIEHCKRHHDSKSLMEVTQKLEVLKAEVSRRDKRIKELETEKAEYKIENEKLRFELEYLKDLNDGQFALILNLTQSVNGKEKKRKN